MIFNYAEQLKYCEIHFKNMKIFLKFMTLNKNDKLEEKINARWVKNFFCTFFNFQFYILHCYVSQNKIKTEKLKILTNDDNADLLFFLKNTHDNHNYQYAISSTCIDHACKFFNISSFLWYIIQILYEIVTLKKKYLMLYCKILTVIWTILMFYFNYDTQTAWFCTEITQAEKDRIITNFINNNETL